METNKIEPLWKYRNLQMSSKPALHYCIDNAIQSAAGLQLREDCHTIMRNKETRKRPELLRSRALTIYPQSMYVLHTVRPIVPRETKVTDKQRMELASSYVACLDLANQVENIKAIAFYAISTGVFGSPK